MENERCGRGGLLSQRNEMHTSRQPSLPNATSLCIVKIGGEVRV